MKNWYLCIGLVFVLLLGVTINGFTQLLQPNQPEQDACNALVLCGSSFYAPYSYQEAGSVTDLTTTPCGTGEANSVWLKLTINTPGNIVFSITPVATSDDYDFAVVDISNSNCNNLQQSQVIRCNFNNNSPVFNNGVIGLNTTSLLTSVAGGTNGSPFLRQINAAAGDVYLIMINNYGSGGGPSSGFTIDFTGSTATFNSPPLPHMDLVQPPVCAYNNEIIIKLSTEVKCNSIATNGSDFYLSPSGGITAAEGINCSGSQGYTNEIKLTFSPALSAGDYTIHAQQGTDGNTLLDLCNNPLPLPDTLSFTVRELTKTVTLTKCQNQLPFIWNGITVTTGGPVAAVAHHTTSFGCDSITTLNLTVLPVYMGTETVTICNSQLPYTWNGIVVATGGNSIATYTGTGIGGCDSIVTLNLNVTPAVLYTVHMIKCPNQVPFVWNGITVTTGGIGVATYTTTSAAQCDSITKLDLMIQQPVSISPSISGCDEVVFEGNTYFDNQVLQDTLSYVSGCDSVYRIINIMVYKSSPVTVTRDTAACGILVFKGVSYTANSTVIDTLPNNHGCDSLYVVTHIVIHPNTPITLVIDSAACDRLVFEDREYNADTILTKMYQNQWGCDSLLRKVMLHVQHFELSLTADLNPIVRGEYVRLNTDGNAPYYVTGWFPQSLFPNQNLLVQRIQPNYSETYKVTARTDLGCLDSVEIKLTVNELVTNTFLPNAFSPNGDGLNDRFVPRFYNERGYVVASFIIYNRWGQSVYNGSGSNLNGWDGTYNNQGKPMETGTYYYHLVINFLNGEQKIVKGDVLLVR